VVQGPRQAGIGDNPPSSAHNGADPFEKTIISPPNKPANPDA
jgi:hypothetical protein